MKKIGIIIICLLAILITGCGSKKTTKEETKKEEEKQDTIIVDVRTKEEYETGHIKGAINIPHYEINEKIDLDKSKTIMVYCKSGTRSAIAYEALKKLGYNVVDLGAYDSIDMEKEK